MKKLMVHLQGVVICVTSLVMALAQDNLDAYVVCYTKAVDRLQKVDINPHRAFLSLFSFFQLVIEHEYSATYAYYKVPSPWLQVKLLRLLQYYPPSGKFKILICLKYLAEVSARRPNHPDHSPPSFADYDEQLC